MNLSLKNLTSRSTDPARRKPANLLGLDFGTSGIKAVRLRKAKEGIQLVAADILPATDLRHPERPDIPKPLSAYYAALCTSAEDSMVRVFSQPLKEGDSVEDAARENLSVPDGHRIAAKVLDRQAGRRESHILGAAISGETAQHFLDLFASGAPAAHSLEIAGLSAFSAFWLGGSRPQRKETICLIEGGTRFTYIGLFHKNKPLLINRFAVGSETLSQQVQQDLGVDAEMAGTILAGGSVDISGSVAAALGSFLKQLSIYREFVERQHKTRLTAVHLSGGLAVCSYWKTALGDLLDMAPQIWNPFDRVTVPEDLDLDRFHEQESRFASALGAALAGMEGDS